MGQPCNIDGDMAQRTSWMLQFGSPFKQTSEAHRAFIMSKIPLNRLGGPGEFFKFVV